MYIDGSMWPFIGVHKDFDIDDLQEAVPCVKQV